MQIYQANLVKFNNLSNICLDIRNLGERRIPEEIIAEALGHSHGNRITAIYIDKSVANIDAANRKVLDFVLYKEQPKD